MENLEKLIHHTFLDELKIDPSVMDGILIADNFNEFDREALAVSLFEKFDVKRVSFENSGICCLFSTGRTTGLVCNSGNSLT